MGVAPQTFTLPRVITTFPVSLPLYTPGGIYLCFHPRGHEPPTLRYRINHTSAFFTQSVHSFYLSPRPLHTGPRLLFEETSERT